MTIHRGLANEIIEDNIMPKDQAKIALILQSCLEKIQSGEATLDSTLEQYPQLADTLRPQLETALWIHKQSQAFDPKPEFIAASRDRLVRRVKYEIASTPPKERVTFWGWLGALRPRKVAFQFALTMLLVLSLLFSTNRLALAASSTLPGDMLYPVKTTHENLQVLFSFTPEGDLELHIDFARQRLVEIEGIFLEGRYNLIPATVDGYQRQISMALSALKVVVEKKSQRAEELAEKLYRVMAFDTRILGGIYDMAPQAVKKEITRVEDISQSGLAEMTKMPLAIAAVIVRTPTATSTQIGELTPGETQVATATLEGTPGAGTPIPSPTSPWWLPTLAGPTSPPWSVTATPTGGFWPTATATATSSVLPPATATPIEGTLPPPTATPIVTNTPAPTATPIATATPVPPTPVPSITPVCNISGWIYPIDPDNPGVRVVMNVSNNSGVTIMITGITIDWPKNHEIQQLELVETSATIWDVGDTTPPTIITGFKEGSEGFRQIPHGASQDITFRFFRSIGITGYQITINFDNDCSVTATQ